MGVPDTHFTFPFSQISECRIVVQDTKPRIEKKVIDRLDALLHHEE